MGEYMGYTRITLYRCPDELEYRCTSVPVHRCTCAPVYWCTGVPVYRYTSVLAYRCTMSQNRKRFMHRMSVGICWERGGGIQRTIGAAWGPNTVKSKNIDFPMVFNGFEG